MCNEDLSKLIHLLTSINDQTDLLRPEIASRIPGRLHSAYVLEETPHTNVVDLDILYLITPLRPTKNPDIKFIERN
jgi:hypothetical protein